MESFAISFVNEKTGDVRGPSMRSICVERAEKKIQILQRPDTWASYDCPRAVETSLNEINNHKMVLGYYTDQSGIHHGFVGKVIESR